MSELDKHSGSKRPAPNEAVISSENPPAEFLDKKDVPHGPVQSASAVLKALETAVVAFRLYSTTNEGCQLHLRNLQQNLKEFFSAFGTLHFEVNYKNIFLKDSKEQPVWIWDGSEDNLIHRLYLDGIYEIEIRPQVGTEELTEYLKILAADYNSFNLLGEDVSSMIWKAELKNISMKTFDGLEQLESIDLADQTGQEQLDRFIHATLHRFGVPNLYDSDAQTASAQPPDLQNERLQGFEFPHSFSISNDARGHLLFLEPEELQVLDAELEKDRHTSFVKRVKDALLEVFAVETDDTHIRTLLTYLNLIAREFLVSGQWREINHLISSLHGINEEKSKTGVHGEVFIRELMVQLASKETFAIFKSSLNDPHFSGGAEELQKLLAYLPFEAGHSIVDLAFGIPRGPVRRAVLDVALQIAKGGEQIFFSLIENLANDDLLDLIYALSKMPRELSLPHLIRLAQDCTGTQKEAALIAIMFSDDSKVKELMTQNLHPNKSGEPPSENQQKIAIRYFSRHRDLQAIKVLKEFTEGEPFQQLSPTQQQRYYMILGEIGHTTILPYFKDVLAQKGGLFNKKNIESQKLCVIAGLSKINDVRSREILESELQNDKNPDKVRQRCQSVLAKMNSDLKQEVQLQEKDS